MGNWKAVGDWGEDFFESFIRGQRLQQKVYKHTRLLKMEHNDKRGYGKIAQDAYIDFLEIRDTVDKKTKERGQYAVAYEIKTDNGALYNDKLSHADDAEKIKQINDTLRPFERTEKTAEVQPFELYGSGNLFVEMTQKTKPGWYTVIKGNKDNLDAIFAEKTYTHEGLKYAFPHIRERHIVYIAVRGDIANLFFIPDDALVSIVDDLIDKGEVSLTTTKSGSTGYPVPINKIYSRSYEDAFITLPGMEEVIPEGKEVFVMGQGQPDENGVYEWSVRMSDQDKRDFTKALAQEYWGQGIRFQTLADLIADLINGYCHEYDSTQTEGKP